MTMFEFDMHDWHAPDEVFDTGAIIPERDRLLRVSELVISHIDAAVDAQSETTQKILHIGGLAAAIDNHNEALRKTSQ